jgi:hypothetical protein
MSALLDVVKGSRIIETLENYPVAFETTHINDEILYPDKSIWIDGDSFFWEGLLRSPDYFWNAIVQAEYCVFSNWIARVPGLFYTEAASSLRSFAKYYPLENADQFGDVNHIYRPLGKSAHVSGGIGTLKLPNDDRGNLLASVSTSANASVGIPILIYPEVQKYLRLEEGDCIKIRNARWKKMSVEWQGKFPTVGGIPRGYIVVDHPDMIIKTKQKTNIQVQPFSIMERQAADGFLYDFVYVSMNAADHSSRQQAKQFFERYMQYMGSTGEYLLAIDPSNPYFDARYAYPQDLEAQDRYGVVQMKLIKERVKGSCFRGFTIDRLAGIIPENYPTAQEIYRLAKNAGIPHLQIPDDAASRMAIVLLEQAIRLDRVAILVELIVIDFPGILTQ